MTHTAGEDEYKDRFIVGFVEPVTIKGVDGSKRLLARVDSGATRSSIDAKIAQELGIGPVIGERTVRNANGRTTRKVVEVTLQLGDEEYVEEFTLADRSHMNFPVLLGRNILEQNFLIDPKKTYPLGEEE
jgi:hypothetical protein